MDPAESDLLKQTLSAQAARVHQVESALRQMSEHMQRIMAGVSQLSGQLAALDERLPRAQDTYTATSDCQGRADPWGALSR
ncbi:hypothetical protein D4764_06G0008340 [Takifugu flavidus]|uniref:Uncharacterized protein n=1 Tax=Takifugu flavidus TaxID=433684 RepID=A0A5C6MVJ3_9TELE|nr:hypothetical protein D4764_06G0008340 [Takifugu flavidus]